MSNIHFDNKDLVRLELALSQSERLVIFPHTAPDGDAIGSTLALATLVQERYPSKSVVVISPDQIERYLKWMPLQKHLLIYPEDTEEAIRKIGEADLFIHMDHNTISRLRYTPLIEAVEANNCQRILIDHHLHPDPNMGISFSYPEVSSTCELTYLLMEALGWEDDLSGDMATSLLTGIITDTGRFSYAVYSPELFAVISKLMHKGGDYLGIIDQLSYHNRYEQLRLQGYVMHQKFEFYPEFQAVVFTLSRQEMQEFGVSKGDTEGLVNIPLSIDGVINACFIREDSTQIKLSLRSTGKFPVNRIASEGFGGGGHLNAAGAEFQGTIEEAKNTYLCILERIYLEYKQQEISNG